LEFIIIVIIKEFIIELKYKLIIKFVVITINFKAKSLDFINFVNYFTDFKSNLSIIKFTILKQLFISLNLIIMCLIAHFLNLSFLFIIKTLIKIFYLKLFKAFVDH
jgi:hypothetical protein